MTSFDDQAEVLRAGLIRFEKDKADTRLRDEFAKAAMQAAATNPAGADGFTFKQRAEWAYQQADAMMEARNANR